MTQSSPLIWVVVPCMGRLSFLRTTAPRVVLDPIARYCLVDYACPDHCGDWLEATFPDAVMAGRAIAHRVAGRTLFNKSSAHNQGARRALGAGAQYLCFLDADTLVAPGFVAWLHEHAARDRFAIAGRRADGTDAPSLTGLLLVHAEAFLESGGFDETFRGWGGEDIEFRIRLALLQGLDVADVPLELVNAIPHGDDLRTRFYQQKSCSVSNRSNLRKLNYRIWNTWKGRWKRDGEALERLWYRGPPTT